MIVQGDGGSEEEPPEVRMVKEISVYTNIYVNLWVYVCTHTSKKRRKMCLPSYSYMEPWERNIFVCPR